ncbi:hypothetical protein [Lichenihabitans psoromatis]|uniref:hypothetical protein n=1 Tax=Lichenihabitans psoromatis TaxID=2528642 RepID=UPI0010384416|nr:hypothetical protein [Lichenihabitans psoromatis]
MTKTSFRASRLWGDGITDDRWSEIAAVETWASCGPDEYIRLFPRLVPKDGRLPSALSAYLATGVLARAWGLGHERLRLRPQGLRSVGAEEIRRKGARCHAEWFASDPFATRWIKRLAGLRSEAGDDAFEQAALSLLDEVVDETMTERLRPFDGTTATMLAFHSGVHPAYLWPAAALSHARETSAGWLGHVARGRPAMMPHDVAEYFIDVIDPRQGSDDAVRDPVMGQLVRRSVTPSTLITAARTVVSGSSAVVHRRLPPLWLRSAPMSPSFYVAEGSAGP